MKNNTIAVLGSSGMLGYAVSEYFNRIGSNIIGVSRKEYDIAKDPIDKLSEIIRGSEIVINCAGVIKPRIAETKIEEVIHVNSVFPRNLAKLCNKNNIKCFHITTDCVYSGKKGRYTEEDYFDAEDIYGMTKNAGESTDCMTLRTSIIGEEKGQSRSLLEWAKSQSGKEINGFTNHFWNGITTVYLAEIVRCIISENLYQYGIFHIHSPNTVSKYELMTIINDVYNLSMRINPFKANVLIDRSLASIYSLSSHIVKKQIKQQIVELMEFFNRAKR
ncbi:MAG TPA: SDR family oxidoreductase [Candidatus Dojkabacteria bacterium]|nr:SDR family oxidoreductase [Candidatus Dojkabacteria bacterium]